MRVDIWSDVICPWCYVGKARFEKALDSFVPFFVFDMALGASGAQPTALFTSALNQARDRQA
jgi:predicted DsbA family dithiol-disulfide isomerase